MKVIVWCDATARVALPKRALKWLGLLFIE